MYIVDPTTGTDFLLYRSFHAHSGFALHLVSIGWMEQWLPFDVAPGIIIIIIVVEESGVIGACQ